MAARREFEGFLAVDNGQRVWWRCQETRPATPVVVLHGGPGSGTSDLYLTWFDPSRHRVVLIDQRNCGRSTPTAGRPTADLSGDTTVNLIGDLELLRNALDMDRWVLAGASWGTTLALAYAQQHPHVVAGMVLVSTVTTSAAEVDWITRGMGRYFPRQWSRFLHALPEHERDGNLAAAYNRLLLSADPSVHGPAAAAWCSWEETHVATDGRPMHDSRFDDEAFRLCFARIVTHYWSHGGFLPDGQLVSNLPRLAGIPAALVHGRRDLSSPAQVAIDIHDAWPDSRLTLVDDIGHGATLETIRAAVDDVTCRSRART